MAVAMLFKLFVTVKVIVAEPVWLGKGAFSWSGKRRKGTGTEACGDLLVQGTSSKTGRVSLFEQG